MSIEPSSIQPIVEFDINSEYLRSWFSHSNFQITVTETRIIMSWQDSNGWMNRITALIPRIPIRNYKCTKRLFSQCYTVNTSLLPISSVKLMFYPTHLILLDHSNNHTQTYSTYTHLCKFSHLGRARAMIEIQYSRTWGYHNQVFDLMPSELFRIKCRYDYVTFHRLDLHQNTIPGTQILKWSISTPITRYELENYDLESSELTYVVTEPLVPGDTFWLRLLLTSEHLVLVLRNLPHNHTTILEYPMVGASDISMEDDGQHSSNLCSLFAP